MNDKILDQADALMRRRSGGAGTNPPSPAATAPPTLDIPVLTEIVEAPPPSSLIGPANAQQLDELIATTLDAHLHEKLQEQRIRIDHEIEDWLTHELPALIDQAVQGLAEQLIDALKERIRREVLVTQNGLPPQDTDTAANE